MSRVKLVLVVLALVGLALLALAGVQNSPRTTDLSIDLAFFGMRSGAWHLARPVPVIALMGGSLLTGLALGAVITARAYGRRVQALRDQLRYGDSPPEYR